MNRITSTKARQNWAQTIEEARTEPLLLTDHGRPTVVMMDAELARLALEVLNDSYDIQEAQKASKRVQNGGKTYSLEEVAADLGIDLADL
ncbi:MAG: type II toxin-antitoxin system prevent-host-death family antitoxin [Micrococcales bacterium]